MNTVQYIDARPTKEFWLLSLLKAVGYVALYMVTMTLFSIINELRLYVVSYNEGWDRDKFIEVAEGQSYTVMIVSAVFTLIVLIALQVLFKKPLVKTFHIKKISLISAVCAFITGVTLNFALNVVMSFLPQEALDEYGESMGTDNIPILIYTFAAVIFAPLIEELIFRNFATSALRRSMPTWLAIALTSIMFGAVHGHWIQMCYAGALGVLLACAFCYSDSIFPSIIIHFGFNSVSLISLVMETVKMTESEIHTFNVIYTVISYFCVFACVAATSALFISIKSSQMKEKRDALLKAAMQKSAADAEAQSGEWNANGQ